MRLNELEKEKAMDRGHFKVQMGLMQKVRRVVAKKTLE